MKILLSTILALAAAQGVLPMRAADAASSAEAKADARTLPDDADAAWTAVQAALKPPSPPAAWNQTKPTQDEYDKFRKEMGTFAGTAADRAKEFYTRWPDHTKAGEARGAQRKMLNAAIGLGVKERSAELAALAPESATESPAAAAKEPQSGGGEEKAVHYDMEHPYKCGIFQLSKCYNFVSDRYMSTDPVVWKKFIDAGMGLEVQAPLR